MSIGYDIKAIVNRNGTNRRNRPFPSLDPASVKIDDRKLEDFLMLAREIAKGIRFVEDPADLTPPGKDFESFEDELSWSAFFAGNPGNAQGNDEPHYALFLAFLELFQLSIDNLNTLTKRHLDFFYQKVLRFARKPEVADKVHVILELASNVQQHVLLEGTRFSAGTDTAGQALQYELLKDTFFSQAKLGAVRQLYFHHEIRDFRRSHDDPADTIALNYVKGIYGRTISDNANEELPGLEPWHPFGIEELSSVEVGWAVASPMLILGEGIRKVTFTITGEFTGDDARLIDFGLLLEDTSPGPGYPRSFGDYFNLSFSTKDGWLPIPIARTDVEGDGKDKMIQGGIGKQDIILNFGCTIPRTAPAICAFPPGFEGASFSSQWPIAKITLSPALDEFVYSLLKPIKLKTIGIRVEVEEVKGLVLSNDQLPISPDRPFAPFGVSPARGSNFHIGSAEIFQKSLDQLTIDLDWYMPDEEVAKAFKASVHMLHEGIWEPITGVGAEIDLFDDEVSLPRKIIVSTHDPNATVVNKELKKKRKIRLQNVEELNRFSQDGFIKLVLTNHPKAHKAGHGGTPQMYVPPYVPMLTGVMLGYKAEHTIHTHEVVDEILHIHPFGWAPYQHFQESTCLVPQYDEEGMIYLGLKDVTPPQQVNILFQLVEGSGYPNVPLPGIEWSYLNGHQWVPFKETQILEDATNQFNRSGIVALRLPSITKDAVQVFSSDHYWICAKTTMNANAACLIRDIRTQAATLSFVLADDVTPGRDASLKPNSITQLVEPHADVKTIHQPYPSYDGKPPEGDNEFYPRVSERQRHKGRAVTLWDYERLVLEEFPALYEAKCFKHFSMETGPAPGSILIVVVADTRQYIGEHRFQPTTSLDRLDRVERYLMSICPPYVSIEARNPVFEEIQVSFLVKFTEGSNPGYYQQQLEEAIQRHLSPWAFEEGEDIRFGGTIYKSSILHFVEKQPYVDTVAFFEMNHADAEGNLGINVEEATATTPISVLVSASSHPIDVIHDHSVVCGDGIGFMIVGKTFKIKGAKNHVINIEDGIGYMILEKTFKLKQRKHGTKDESHP